MSSFAVSTLFVVAIFKSLFFGIVPLTEIIPSGYLKLLEIDASDHEQHMAPPSSCDLETLGDGRFSVPSCIAVGCDVGERRMIRHLLQRIGKIGFRPLVCDPHRDAWGLGNCRGLVPVKPTIRFVFAGFSFDQFDTVWSEVDSKDSSLDSFAGVKFRHGGKIVASIDYWPGKFEFGRMVELCQFSL